MPDTFHSEFTSARMGFGPAKAPVTSPSSDPGVIGATSHQRVPASPAGAPAATTSPYPQAAGASLAERLDAVGHAVRAGLESRGYVVVFNVLNPRWSGLALRKNVRDPLEMDQKALLAMSFSERRALHERLCK